MFHAFTLPANALFSLRDVAWLFDDACNTKKVA